MSRYTVFLPAPSFKELKTPTSRSWISGSRTLDVSSRDDDEVADEQIEGYHHNARSSDEEEERARQDAISTGSIEDSLDLASSQRVSRIYKGDIFRDVDLEEEYTQSQREDLSDSIDPPETSNVTEAYEWSLSQYPSQESAAPSSQGAAHARSYISTRAQTQTTSVDETSTTDVDITRDSSDASIRILPDYQILPQQLASLNRLHQPQQQQQRGGRGAQMSRPYRDADRDPFENPNTTKISVLVGILDLDGPNYVRLKQGVDVGKEVALLKLVLMDGNGVVVKLTVWRDLADTWGDQLKKGDVVLFQNILFTRSTDGSSTGCTASENLKSKATICYRTVATTREDRRLRPDLRLAALDPGMAKVAQVVQLMQQRG
ncbi:hypothetical protein FRC17_005527 [Serendipita sp. 399]|nr:hypothetical protein FRC17_005527 [Serendipita sp. 399]